MTAHETGTTTHPPVLGVAGLPHVVAASLSPPMFAAAFRELGITGYYVPLAVRERSARKALRSLPRLGFRGANVTMPYKALAAEVAHSRSELVELTGVANTLIIDDGGHIHAEATDGAGVLDALQRRSVPLAGSDVTVLGAGGAATEAAFALARAGAARMRIWNRTRDRAEALASLLQSVFPALVLELPDDVPIHAPAHVLVSAVPRDALPPATLADMHPGMVVVDLAYRPDRQPTALIEVAKTRASAWVDGREVLVLQGAAAFRLWFDAEPPVEVMSRAVT